ncbi:MAG: hypothetical protein ABSE07_06455 [Methanoregula sp.]
MEGFSGHSPRGEAVTETGRGWYPVRGTGSLLQKGIEADSVQVSKDDIIDHRRKLRAGCRGKVQGREDPSRDCLRVRLPAGLQSSLLHRGIEAPDIGYRVIKPLVQCSSLRGLVVPRQVMHKPGDCLQAPERPNQCGRVCKYGHAAGSLYRVTGEERPLTAEQEGDRSRRVARGIEHLKFQSFPGADRIAFR